MKIIVVGLRGFPNIQGGIEAHCKYLYPALVELGCDITVFTRVPYADANLTEYQGVKLVPVRSVKNKFLEAFFHTRRCIELAKEMKPDIIHIHAVGPSFFAAMAKRVCHCKVVVTHHGPDYMRKKWSLPAKLSLRFFEWRGMSTADEIITLEPGIAETIRKKFHREAKIIPNGVGVHELYKKRDTLKRFGLSAGHYIMAVGRLVPEKGFDDLIEAYVTSDIKMPLVICGTADHSGGYSTELERKARKAGVILAGYLESDELYQLYSHTGLFVLSSHYEGLPIVLLEAMSFGAPYLATDIKATKSLPLDNERMFVPGDIDGLAKKLKEFAGKLFSENEKIKMVNYVKEKHSWKLIAEQTLEVYKAAMSKNG